MPDYGFVHDGRVLTPDQTPGFSPETTDARNRALEVEELACWQTAPERFVAYYTTKTVSTWLGTIIGTVLSYTIYTSNFGGRLIAFRMRGTNGAEYWGRASYDDGSIVRLRKCRTMTKDVGIRRAAVRAACGAGVGDCEPGDAH